MMDHDGWHESQQLAKADINQLQLEEAMVDGTYCHPSHVLLLLDKERERDKPRCNCCVDY